MIGDKYERDFDDLMEKITEEDKKKIEDPGKGSLHRSVEM